MEARQETPTLLNTTKSLRKPSTPSRSPPPTLIASTVGKSPAHPTMPVTTTLAASSVAQAITPSCPAPNMGHSARGTPSWVRRASRAGRRLGSWRLATAGRNSLICSAKRSTLFPEGGWEGGRVGERAGGREGHTWRGFR